MGTAVKDLPEIALYVDSYWNQGIGSQPTGSDDIYDRVKDCREYANKLVGVLLARVDNTLKGDGVMQ